jgi:hypothetical protein
MLPPLLSAQQEYLPELLKSPVKRRKIKRAKHHVVLRSCEGHKPIN